MKQQQHWIYCWFLGQARVAGKALNRKPPNHPQLFSIITVCFVFTTTKKKNGKLNDKNPPPHFASFPPGFCHSVFYFLPASHSRKWRGGGHRERMVSPLSSFFFFFCPACLFFVTPTGPADRQKKNAKVKIYK